MTSMLDAVATAMPDAVDADAPPACEAGNDYDPNDLGIRISAIFVILVGSLFGATFPVFARRAKANLMPPVVFFIAKYFGSGVIVATAFIHLLAPASEALTDPCLTGPITDYDWAEGIALMMVFVLFFIELIIMRSGMFENHSHTDDDDDYGEMLENAKAGAGGVNVLAGPSFRRATVTSMTTPSRGEDHLGHTREHDHDHSHDREHEGEVAGDSKQSHNQAIGLSQALDNEASHTHRSYDDYAAQMTAIFVLEFGVIFHSIFIGLTLAVTGSDELSVLYVVLVFHQTFEGLGLGTRLALTPWPKTFRGRVTPYLLAVGYALSTPIAIAIGLGVRETYAPGSATSLIVNGVFDSISAGILLYTGLVELMAHEFMFSETMRKAKTSVMISAFLVMCLGAGLMALLGKWA